MKYTTTRLSLSIRDRWPVFERTIRDCLTGAMMIVAVLLIHSLLAPVEAPPRPMQPIVTQQHRPVIVIQTAVLPTPQPTYTPLPTLEPIVMYVEAPAPKPEIVVIYQEAPVQAQPTLAPPIEPTDGPQLQTIAVQPEDESMSPALMREAMDR